LRESVLFLFKGTKLKKNVLAAYRSARTSPASLLWALLAVGVAAFAVEIPFFFLGLPSGHDVEFHLYSWLEVLTQWRHGIWLPRWASLAHFAYGEPRFLFYPPASWMLGGLLSAIFPWTIVAGVYIWLALTLAGLSMFALARRWLDRPDAIFAAVFYAVNPYHLVIVYWRSAFAELLASCLVPLLLLFTVKLAEGERRAAIPLSLVLAASWLTNIPAALMIHYSLALLLLLFAWQQRATRVLWVGAAAILLGACLASFYLLPAIYEQRWIDVAQAISQGYRPHDNFLFVHTADADHDRFNRIISWVAMLEFIGTLSIASIGRMRRDKNRQLWATLLRWAAICGLLMLPETAVLWKYLPKLEFMQFPWRWLLCLSTMFVIFLTLGLRRWWMRFAVCAVTILVIATAWLRIQPPWWDNIADLKEMQDNMTDGIGYEGVEEYTPLWADPTAVDKNAPRVTVEKPAQGTIQMQQWSAESKTFTAEMSAAGELTLRLFRYPAWQVEVNGHAAPTRARQDTGQIVVPVEAGANHIQVTFIRTWDRTLGACISAAMALSMIGGSLTKRLAYE
jgi:hypothetical protein